MMVIITYNLPTSVILCKERASHVSFCKIFHSTIQQYDVSIKLNSRQAANILSVVLAVLTDKANTAPSVHQSSEKN